jgi:hypothetical protein
MILAGLLLAASAHAAKLPANHCLSYQPAVVRLKGRIVERMAYGPPSFGEDRRHDRIEHFLVLRLDHPICVDAAPGDAVNIQSEAGVPELMIVPPVGPRLPRGRAEVTGWLFHAVTAHHRTRVLITVTGAQQLNVSK